MIDYLYYFKQLATEFLQFHHKDFLNRYEADVHLQGHYFNIIGREGLFFYPYIQRFIQEYNKLASEGKTPKEMLVKEAVAQVKSKGYYIQFKSKVIHFCFNLDLS